MNMDEKIKEWGMALSAIHRGITEGFVPDIPGLEKDVKEAATVLAAIAEQDIAREPVMVASIGIVRRFLAKNRVLGYGGMAINTAVKTKFYDFSLQVADFDCYSTTPHKHAVELADMLFEELNKRFPRSAYTTPLAMWAAGSLKTTKLTVGGVPLIDFSYVDPGAFEVQWNHRQKDEYGISYVTVDMLRAGMMKEFGEAKAQVSRWPKVLKRLLLLNTEVPMAPCVVPHNVAPERPLPPRIYESFVRYLLKNQDRVVLVGANAVEVHAGREGPKGWSFPLEVLSPHKEVIKELSDMFGGTGNVIFPEANDVLWEHVDIMGADKLPVARLFFPNNCITYVNTSGISVGILPVIYTTVAWELIRLRDTLPKTRLNVIECTLRRIMDMFIDASLRTEVKGLLVGKCMGVAQDKREKLIERAQVEQLMRRYSNHHMTPILRDLFWTYYDPSAFTKYEKEGILQNFKSIDYRLLYANIDRIRRELRS